MNNEERLRLERSVVRRLVDDVLAAGYSISVDDGGDALALRASRDAATIVAAATAVDEARLYVISPDRRQRIGGIFLVFGNSPWEPICDYTASPEIERLLRGANALAEAIEQRHG